MPTYFVTNRTAKDATTLRPLSDPIAVLKSPNDNDADYNQFAPLTQAQWDALKNDMPNEAQALANQEHYPLIIVFIHGYNNNTDAALQAMSTIGSSLVYSSLDEAGQPQTRPAHPLMVCFDWPSNHQVWDYLGDEGDAMQSVPAVMQMLDFLHNWRDPINCRVNVCVIAHSMGNFVLMQGMLAFWKKLGRPASLPYLSEVLMAAADIDSDSLIVGGAGDGITSLSRRVTVYFTRNDNTLGVSHLIKHPGAARLGRVGPNDVADLPRNVVSVDCTNVIKPVAAPGDFIAINFDRLFLVHGSYWNNAEWELDAGDTLLNVDRQLVGTRSSLDTIGVQFTLKEQRPD